MALSLKPAFKAKKEGDPDQKKQMKLDAAESYAARIAGAEERRKRYLINYAKPEYVGGRKYGLSYVSKS